MVDVSGKAVTHRTAVAQGTITMSGECFALVKAGRMKKGDVLVVAQVAGIMAAKRTSDLIPLCHILALTKCQVEFTLLEDRRAIQARCTVSCDGKTGVEMEAMTGVSVTLLTIYDMCKAMDRGMRITDIHLMEKDGGKSGHYVCEESCSD